MIRAPPPAHFLVRHMNSGQIGNDFLGQFDIARPGDANLAGPLDPNPRFLPIGRDVVKPLGHGIFRAVFIEPEGQIAELGSQIIEICKS